MEKYQRIRTLGWGDFTKVYLVEDTETGDLCVVKQIDSGLPEHEQEKALHEAALLRVLRHPHIIRYGDAFITRMGSICLVMEYADRGDLHHLLEEHRFSNELLHEALVVRWLAQLCDALTYLHERNVLHRDIKARNVFLRQGGDALLGDFGISSVMDSPIGLTNAAAGTPSYASPERMSRLPYGASADVWSLGVVAYELCSLRRPFQASSFDELTRQIIAGEFEPLDDHVSLDLQNLVVWMLAHDPTKRPTAAALLEQPLLHEIHRESLPQLTACSALAPFDQMELGGSHHMGAQLPELAVNEAEVELLDLDCEEAMNRSTDCAPDPRAAWPSRPGPERNRAPRQRQSLMRRAQKLLGLGRHETATTPF